jgi:hypothetical protein
MLFLTVSFTIHGFWVTKLIEPLIETLGLVAFYLNFIYPKSEYMSDDFPAPMLPMMATNSPRLMVKFMSIRFKSVYFGENSLFY